MILTLGLRRVSEAQARFVHAVLSVMVVMREINLDVGFAKRTNARALP